MRRLPGISENSQWDLRCVGVLSDEHCPWSRGGKPKVMVLLDVGDLAEARKKKC